MEGTVINLRAWEWDMRRARIRERRARAYDRWKEGALTIETVERAFRWLCVWDAALHRLEREGLRRG